jgi:catalase
MNGASQEVLERHIANCTKADPAYGRGVAKALGISVQENEHVSAK